MIVIDTSAVVVALAGQPPNARLRRRLAQDGDLHAPHLIDIEFLHVLRRLTSSQELSMERAADARLDFSDLAIVRYPHQALADRIWELRDNFSAYDAVFVALSEALGAPLVTNDARLARAPGHGAMIELC